VKLRLATRSSPLARWQAETVATLLVDAVPGIEPELVLVGTEGDRRQDVPLWMLGGKGVFVKEVQAALLDGRADAAVHSAKDLPAVTHDALVLASVPPRGDPRDALAGRPLAELRPGARVATGSARRRAQLAWARPDLSFVELRGNIATRLGRLDGDDVQAVVVAAAALDRLGWMHRAAEILAPAVMLPQVGQGAMAIEARADAPEVIAALEAIDDAVTHRLVTAERAFLQRLGGDCDLPAGAHATLVGDPDAAGSGAAVRVEGMLASLDGRVLARRSVVDVDGVAAGDTVAGELADGIGALLRDR
jgi:hydroxymethylbilane synthase